MVSKVRIYVEGGNTRLQKRQMRNAFAQFLGKVPTKKRIEVIASGDRGQTYKDFCRENRMNSKDLVLLLVDSEGPVTPSSWAHLQHQDNWPRPKGVQDDQCHFMVQFMESWFIADVEMLRSFYGSEFNINQIPKNPNIEQVSKSQIESSLKTATAKTKKRAYHKMKHGPELLKQLNPEKVRHASKHFEKFLHRLESP